MYGSIGIHISLSVFQIRGDIAATLSGLINKLFYADQFPEFSAIVSVAPDDWDKVRFCFLCVQFISSG